MVSRDRARLRGLCDHVEFVVFRIQESGPADAAHLDIRLPFRTEADHFKGLKKCGVFSADDLRLVERENILSLLPRFKG